MAYYFYPSLMLAGGCGALLRYLLSRATVQMNWSGLPYGTLLVNVVGSFLIGYLATLMLQRGAWSTELQTVLLSGFLGGFTTFSAFSLETVSLLTDGAFGKAFLYIFLQLALCLFFCFVGLLLARQ